MFVRLARLHIGFGSKSKLKATFSGRNMFVCIYIRIVPAVILKKRKEAERNLSANANLTAEAINIWALANKVAKAF